MKPTSMRGGGYYDHNSSIQRNTNSQTIPHLQQAVADIALPQVGSPFCLVDFGSSEGKNSQDCIEAVVDCLLKRNSKQNIVVVHNDLPTNDFNRLFSNVYDKDSYYQRHQANGTQIFVLASGESFYEQVMPNDSVHLAFSSWACQWLSQSPAIQLTDHIYFGGATGSNRAAFAMQAETDLITFLSKRAIELTSGGKLVLVIPSSLGDPLNDATTTGGAMNLMNNHLQTMVSEGHISKEKYESFVFPFYFRSKEEILKPIVSTTSTLAGLFTVNAADEERFPCPFYADYLQSKDINQYADRYVNWLRAWSEPVIRNGIFGSAQDKVELFYSRIKADIIQKPEDYVFSVSVIFLTLTKI